MTVALYARISNDPKEQRVGVDDQVRRLARYAEQHWPGVPTATWDDNDITAADPDVDRPGYSALLDAIRGGDITAVVAVEQSRITRQPAQWEELCLTLTRAGIGGVHTISGGFVSVAPAMRLVGRVMAAVDAEEVERTRARVRAAHARLRAEGRPAGGRPYGYRNSIDEQGRATLVVVPDQAAVIEEVARRVLAGESLATIADDLDARGVPTAREGTRWRATALSSILSRDAIAGMRDGTPATWPAILDAETWRALEEWRAMPARWRTRSGGVAMGSKDRAPAFDYLLAGLATCGCCGWTLRGNRQWRRDGSTVASYACRRANNEPRPGDGGPCGGVSIAAVPLDETIAADVIRLARDPVVVAAATTDRSGERAALLAEVAAAEAAIADMAAEYGAGTIGAAEWRAGREAAQGRLTVARGALAAVPVVTSIDPAEVADTWATRSIGERRRVVALFIDAVEVAPMRWLRDPAAAPAEWPRDGDGRPLRVVVRWRA